MKNGGAGRSLHAPDRHNAQVLSLSLWLFFDSDTLRPAIFIRRRSGRSGNSSVLFTCYSQDARDPLITNIPMKIEDVDLVSAGVQRAKRRPTPAQCSSRNALYNMCYITSKGGGRRGVDGFFDDFHEQFPRYRDTSEPGRSLFLTPTRRHLSVRKHELRSIGGTSSTRHRRSYLRSGASYPSGRRRG